MICNCCTLTGPEEWYINQKTNVTITKPNREIVMATNHYFPLSPFLFITTFPPLSLSSPSFPLPLHLPFLALRSLAGLDRFLFFVHFLVVTS